MSSPSVQTQTIDKSYYQPGFTNEIAAYVGYFEKGPVNTPVFITDINEFKFLFGRGIDLYHNDWYQVYNYLQYASGIWVVRAAGNKQWNANSGSWLYINSKEEFEDQYNDIDTIDGIRVISKTPGESGNLLTFAFFGHLTFDANYEVHNGYRAKDLFTSMNDNESGVVIFRNGKVVEKFQLDTYSVNTISTLSKYVYVKVQDFNTLKEFYGATLIELKGGSTNFATDDDFKLAHDVLKNKESYDIDIIIGNQMANELAIDVAESRRDCIAFIGLPTNYINILKINGNNGAECLYTQDGQLIIFGNFNTPRTLSQADMERMYKYIETMPHSEFVHFTCNVKSQVDGFTGKTKLVNIAADAAGLKSKVSLISPWTAAAGLERGIILNGEAIQINIDAVSRKRLYARGMNFVENAMLMSQKTYIQKPSSFDRVHIRALFNHIEKSAERILRKSIFEENREGTRRTIALELKNLLNDVKANRGIEAGKVIVHPAIDDPRAITIDVYVKPTYISEYIQLRMNNTGTNTISSILSNTLG
jgi:hypothetical protein